MIGWLNQLQHARGRDVVFVAILERVVDDLNIATWQPQIEGSKTSRELPGIVDEIITMQWVDFGDGKPVRAFVCTSPNPWQFPAKDRAGRLEQIEEPHLGKLITKLISPGRRKPFIVSPEQSLTQAAE
jgi:AAA domain